MEIYEDAVAHEEIPQKFRKALNDKKTCLTLAHAACILMARNRHLSPCDAALDACQAYCCLLEWQTRHRDDIN